MTETLRTLEVLAATLGFGTIQPTPFFDQGHLRGKVKTFQHFHRFGGGTKADVLGAAVRRASHKPETLQVIVTVQLMQSGDQTRPPRAGEGLRTSCQPATTCIWLRDG